MRFPFFLLFIASVCGFGGPIVGGDVERDPSKYTKTAWRAVAQVNDGTSGGNYLVPIKVIEAHTRVIKGFRTTLEVVFGESTCSSRMDLSSVTSANCPVKEGGAREIYKVKLLAKPWMRFLKVTATKERDVKKEEKF